MPSSMPDQAVEEVSDVQGLCPQHDRDHRDRVAVPAQHGGDQDYCIGREILLTWGGSILSSIVNPEGGLEVLIKVGLTMPLAFLSNWVKYSCDKELAETMLGLMLDHEKGVMDLTPHCPC